MSTNRASVLALIASLPLLAGCTAKLPEDNSAGNAEAAAQLQPAGRAPILLVTMPPKPKSETNVTGMAGLTAGAVAIRNDCLVLIAKTGPVILPVFPHGMANWNEDSRTLNVNGKMLEIGNWLELGGGNMPKAMTLSAVLSNAVKRCAPDEVFLVAG